MNRILRSLQVSVGLALTLLIAQARSAEAAVLQWSLTFFSNQNQVGTGEFSYDTDLVAVVKSPFPNSDVYVAGKDAPLRPDFIPPIPGLWNVTRYPNPLVSFSARLPGQDWTLLGVSWFNTLGSGSPTGSFTCSRINCSASSQWSGGSPFGFVPGQFVMFATGGGGDQYSGSFLSAPLPSAPGTFVSGTWEAVAVPEPTTVIGTMVMGLGYFASRKRRTKS